MGYSPYETSTQGIMVTVLIMYVHGIFKTCDTITMIPCTCLGEEMGYCINKFTHIKLILLLVQNAGEVIPQLCLISLGDLLWF